MAISLGMVQANLSMAIIQPQQIRLLPINHLNNQQNYTSMDEDPFASSKGPIEVSDDDLPF